MCNIHADVDSFNIAAGKMKNQVHLFNTYEWIVIDWTGICLDSFQKRGLRKGWLRQGFVYLSKNLPDDSLTNDVV